MYVVKNEQPWNLTTSEEMGALFFIQWAYSLSTFFAENSLCVRQ